MSMEEFHRLPRQLGWKYDYWNGEAHIRPWNRVAVVRKAVEPQPAGGRGMVRLVRPTDEVALSDLFRHAFGDTPEFCDWPPETVRKSATDTILGFFMGERGDPLPASRLAMAGGSVVGAALLVDKAAGPLLDLLMVHPEWRRQGLATALASTALQALHAAEKTVLYSCYDLANRPSAAWHAGFGFVEEPDLMLAQTRLHLARHELWRLEKAGSLTSEQRSALERKRQHWDRRVAELEALADREGFESVFPLVRVTRFKGRSQNPEFRSQKGILGPF